MDVELEHLAEGLQACLTDRAQVIVVKVVATLELVFKKQAIQLSVRLVLRHKIRIKHVITLHEEVEGLAEGPHIGLVVVAIGILQLLWI